MSDDLNIDLALSPGGHLRIAVAVDRLPPIPATEAKALEEAFGKSTAAGLLLLASHQVRHGLPPSLAFWRDLARELFDAICQLGEEALDRWSAASPPSTGHLAELVSDAPPMRGLEYLTAEVLTSIWRELAAYVAAEAARSSEGPAGYLQRLNLLWHLVGRVTFHLAENKRDPDRPFVFLATYTHRLSGRARPAHLPLAEALKTYAGAKELATLESLLEPVRRAAEQSELTRELLETKALFAPQAWPIRQAYRFLKEAPLIEQAGVVVRLPDWWSARRTPRPQVQVQLGSRRASEIGTDRLLDFRIDMVLDGQPLTDEEQRELLAGAEGLRVLRGKWVEVNQQQLKQALDHWKKIQKNHANGIDFIEGMRLLAGAELGEGSDEADPENGWSRITAGDWLRETLERMRSPQPDAACRPGRDLAATLRPYQVEGVNWLWFMTELGLGACLADDMGLGKTIQVIDLLLQRKRIAAAKTTTQSGPSLLIVPASLLGNWRQELARFAPTLRPLFAHRSETSAENLARVVINPAGELASYDVVLTTYGLARRQDWLTKMRWPLVVLDEAQAIKNSSSAQAKSVKKLPSACRLVLTGTPVENHLGDLWSIFDFCSPGLLGSAAEFKRFVKRLNKQPDYRAYGGLRRLVRPYILRRMKTDPAIVPDLPEKTEMRTECGLSKKQAALYAQAVKELSRRLKEAEGIARRGLVLAKLMQLKQICNHPAQYLGRTEFRPEESGKFGRLAMLCEPIAERQEKALVFTQFQTLTAPLAEFLATVFGQPGLVLHGGVPVGKRAELVRQFQDDLGQPFFVISLKAGGTGLNLTAASHVIHFDRWWNPAVENQATDRAFRIGQRRNVIVHKFVCRGTVEERIDAMIRDKQFVADRILDEAGETHLTELTDDELLRFITLDIGRATVEDG
jgi:non-specific serine/threonine protein kinase